MFPWSFGVPPLRQPGYQACDLIHGFAPPPHSGFAFLGKGSSAMYAPETNVRALGARGGLVKSR